MPKKALTEEQVTATRNRIMDAAAELMAVEGVMGLSMRSLSRELGMTAANIYNYFPGKNQLYLATTRRGYELLADFVDQHRHGSTTAREDLVNTLKASARFATTRTGYWELMFHPPITLRDNVDQEFIEADRILRSQTFEKMLEAFESVQAWYREKGVSDSQLAIKTISALTTIHGLVDLHNHRIMQNFGLDPESLDGLVDMILDDLFPE